MRKGNAIFVQAQGAVRKQMWTEIGMHSLLNDRLAHLFKDIFATKPQGNTTTDHLQGPKGRVVGGGWVTAGFFVKLEFCKRRIFGVKNGPLSEDDRKTWSNKRAHI